MADCLRIPLGADLTMEVVMYAGDQKTPALCIPGLTRNAADFEELAPRIAATGRDVAAVSLRGRGRSDADTDPSNYFPTTYRDDVAAVMDALGWRKAIFAGTSLGGIVTMLLAERDPSRIAAAIINDVGPELAPEGLARIGGYVGNSDRPVRTIEEAADCVAAINAVAFPDATQADWIEFARRTFRETGDGWVLAYDPKIAEALLANGPAPDLWPGWRSLKNTPTLLVHGALSDLLTAPIVEKMREAHPVFDYVRVPRIGHAPMMTEPAAWAAIETFLEKID